MTKYVVQTEGETDALIERLTESIRIEWTDGITTKYCDKIKHPTLALWATIIQPTYEGYFTSDEINNSVELSGDWFLTLDITPE